MRLFVSVPVPSELREKVSALGEEISGDGIIPVSAGNMHLTLKFIGEAGPHDAEEVRKKLSAVGFRKFECRVVGVGVFPHAGFVRVVWAGVDSGGALEALAGSIGDALRGYGADDRFTAHLTIARVKRKADMSAFLRRHEKELFGSFTVERFELMESVLGGGGGPRYSVLESFGSRG
ncbi:MAG: RNA 2',3'-cyclic phosphodiesterase [Candidatus Micrarchaeia archaeon]